MDKVKSVFLMFFVLFINLLFFDMGMTQTKRADETIFLSGQVKDVSWDHKTIIINDKKFLISHDTRVEDQKGNRLKLGDVKNNAEVAIDAIRQPDGYMVKKVVVITDRGV